MEPEKQELTPLALDALGGSEIAHRHLWTRTDRLLRRRAAGKGAAMGLRYEDLGDVVQEAMTRAFRRLSTFSPARSKSDDPFAAWVTTILDNVIKNRVRRGPPEQAGHDFDNVPSPPPQEVVDAWRTLSERFQSLTERERDVLIGTCILGRSQEEVGRALGVDHSSVSRIRSRALSRLREDGSVAPRRRTIR